MGPDSLDISQRSLAGDISLNVSGPRVDRATAKADLTQGLEIEAKFFLPRELARKVTRSIPFAQIEQRYFKRNLVRPLLERFLNEEKRNATDDRNSMRIGTPPGEREDFSIARIRRTRYPKQEPTYFIEFKGAKEGDSGFRISRRELSLPISSKQYKALKEEATAGTLRKRRYSISGTLTVNGETIPAVAQVDCLQAAGKKLHKVAGKFDTVDIELNDPRHIHALRAGHHSFAFLQKCVELSAHDEKLGKSLTTRRLAKNGLHSDALKAIKKLEAEALKRRNKDLN
jgi:hypothetical protein